LSSTWRRIVHLIFGGDTPPSNRDRVAYRASDPLTRVVETRYADRLDEIVDAIANNPWDRRPAEQLAADLSGRYVQLAADLSGRYVPFTMKWESKVTQDATTAWGVLGDTTVFIEGQILDDQGKLVGICERKFSRDADGYLVVENVHLELKKEAQKKGFGKALYDTLEDYYRKSRVDVITVHAALDIGGYAWARRGFDWDPDPDKLEASFANIRRRINELINDAATDPADRELLREQLDRLDVDGQEWPTPIELTQLGVDGGLGRKLMEGTEWFGIFPLSDRGRRYGT
jgi:GNAT superfamily N-acetyltransferase